MLSLIAVYVSLHFMDERHEHPNYCPWYCTREPSLR